MRSEQPAAATAWPGNSTPATAPQRERAVDGHVFISYRSDDAEFALLLAAALRRAGIRLWMDRLSILPGEDWRSVLQDALHSAVAIIPVISRGYVASRYCQRELSRADRIGCPIVPVLLERIDETQWPMEVERAQYFDFSDWRSPNRFRHDGEQLVTVLRRRFGERIGYRPDETERALGDLALELYTRRGLQEYLEQASQVDRVISQDRVRPEPPGLRAWMEQAAFVVIDHAPALTGMAQPTGRRSAARPLSQIRERHPRLMLVGEPGSGKTSALINLALGDIHHWQLLRTGPLPLLIHLADWEDDMSVADLIRAHWSLPGDPLRLLARGRVTLYMDGLNEIAGHRHHKVGLLRKWLASATAPQQLVITCRAQDYRFDLSLGLPLAQGDPLTPDNLRFFVQSWLGPQAAPRLLQRLLGDPDGEIRPLRLLARNLFLLGALCLLHKSRPESELVENRGALLRQATAEMWLRQPDDSLFTGISLQELEAGLGALAGAMIAADSGVYVSQHFALERVGRRDLLEAALRANFLQRRGERLRFTWQAQMEYFAALAQRDGAFLQLLPPPLTGEGGDRRQDGRESMIITAACLSDRPEETLLAINRVNPFLALRCIANGIDVPPRTVEPIVGNLIRVAHSARHDARVASAGALAEIDPGLALPVLLGAMRDGAPAVRRAAVPALWQLDVAPLESLRESLAQAGPGLLEATRVAIHNLRERALPTLLMLLMNEDAELRRRACQGLAWSQDAAAVPGLVLALRDGHEAVCIEASAALGALGDAMAAPPLVANLRHDNWRVRRAAVMALAALGTPALETLLPELESDEATMRRLATAALSCIDAPEADRALRRMRRDADERVRKAAGDALRAREMGQPGALLNAPSPAQPGSASTSPDTLDSLLGNLQRSAWGERESAARALTAWAQHFRGKPNAHIVARLCQVLREPDWMLRWAAVEALAALGNPAAGDALAPLLQDTNQPLRIAALRALMECGDAGALRHLLPLARDPDNLVREALAEALGRLAQPEGIPALGALCRDREHLVRLAAVMALGEAGRREGERHAIAALQDSDPMVRWYAVATLERIGTRRSVPALRALLDEHSHPHWEPREIGELARHVLQQLDAAGPSQQRQRG